MSSKCDYLIYKSVLGYKNSTTNDEVICMPRGSPALNVLNSSSVKDIEKANFISVYVIATTNSKSCLTIGQIDGILRNLTDKNDLTKTKETILIMTQPNFICENATVIGASFHSVTCGRVINNLNRDEISNSIHRMLASSIIIAIIDKESHDPDNIIIDLYFQTIILFDLKANGTYLCVFYDTQHFTME
jgi:hypothetical protein